jgi:hypothetical protein
LKTDAIYKIYTDKYCTLLSYLWKYSFYS